MCEYCFVSLHKYIIKIKFIHNFQSMQQISAGSIKFDFRNGHAFETLKKDAHISKHLKTCCCHIHLYGCIYVCMNLNPQSFKYSNKSNNK